MIAKTLGIATNMNDNCCMYGSSGLNMLYSWQIVPAANITRDIMSIW